MTRVLAMLAALAPVGIASAQTVVPGAGPVSGKEVDAFVHADVNGDGHLTPAEFRVFVLRMAEAGQPTAGTIRAFGAYGIAFRRVDANRDGLASPAELRRADDRFRAGG